MSVGRVAGWLRELKEAEFALASHADDDSLASRDGSRCWAVLTMRLASTRGETLSEMLTISSSSTTGDRTNKLRFRYHVR